MGYNFAAAFAPPLTLVELALSKEFKDQHNKQIEEKFFGKSPMAEFDGPVTGFPNVTPKPKIEIAFNPINIGKTAAMLLDLRAEWLETFLGYVRFLNPKIPIRTAVEWVDQHFPRTIDALQVSIKKGGPVKFAHLMDEEWREKP
jgi:hypothetical protein